MTTLIYIIHIVSGLIVLAEALYQLESSRPTVSGLTWRKRADQALCAVAWILIAGGAGWAVAAPMMDVAGPPICWSGMLFRIGQPETGEVFVLAGAAAIVLHWWALRAYSFGRGAA